MLGAVFIIRKYTSCKNCPYIQATRLFFGMKLKVEMNTNMSAFREISFDVTRNKDLTFLSNKNIHNENRRYSVLDVSDEIISFFFSFFLLFKTRIKASSDFQSALVFITPRPIRVDSAHNSSNKNLLAPT